MLIVRLFLPSKKKKIERERDRVTRGWDRKLSFVLFLVIVFCHWDVVGGWVPYRYGSYCYTDGSHCKYDDGFVLLIFTWMRWLLVILILSY